MGVTIQGVSSTLASLRRSERRTNKRMLRLMRRGAQEVADRARQYAPVDEGNLEDAIEVAETSERFFGNARQVSLVGVNPEKLGEGYTKYGYRYDIRMHEDTTYELGPRSRAKQEATGKKVGSKFLARAYTELEPSIRARAEQIARDIERG